MTTDPAVLLAGAQGAPLRLGMDIKGAEQAMMGAKAEALRELDITVQQYAVLLQLTVRPGMSGAQLARGAAVTPQTMAGILGNLEGKGLVEREPSEVHGKVLVTRLSEAGRRLVAAADARAVAVESVLWEAFDDTERELFRSYLQRVAAALQK